MNKPVLITGASGFVGAQLALYFAARGREVIALGGKHACPVEVGRTAAATLQCDLTQLGTGSRVIAQYKPEAVVHAAALASTARCEADPADAERKNAGATKHLLDACLEAPAAVRPFFLLISTDMVYDGAEAPPGGFSESDPACPLSIYSQTKRRAEELVCAAPLDAAVLRTALVFGSRIGRLAGFLDWLVAGLKAGRCTLFRDEYRTPVSSDDVCRAAERLLDGKPGARAAALDEPGSKRLVHVAGASRVSRVQLGEAVCDAFGLDRRAIIAALRSEQPSPTPRPGDISLSTAKLERCLGIRTAALADGLQRVKGYSDQ